MKTSVGSDCQSSTGGHAAGESLAETAALGTPLSPVRAKFDTHAGNADRARVPRNTRALLNRRITISGFIDHHIDRATKKKNKKKKVLPVGIGKVCFHGPVQEGIR